MNTVEIKTEIRQMIENEMDIGVLEAIRTILKKTSLNPLLRDKLTARAIQSERDIESNNVFSQEEVIRRTNRK